MGTRFRITVSGASDAEVDKAAHAAFTEVDRIEQLMSEWRPDSEVTAINQNAGVKPVKVSPETFEVVQRSLKLAKESQGAFDPTWAALKGLWDFNAEKPKVPTPEAIEARLKFTGWQKVKIDEAARTVFLTEKGMALGLGGIAKGYGIDRAARVLREHGLSRFIVDGGGDLYVAGKKADGSSWTLGVQDPRAREQLMAALPIEDASMVTSGDYERFFEKDGRRYHHIIDLRTGYPANKARSVTVRAPEATLADAMATAIFILGPEAGLAFAKAHPGVETAIVGADGKLVVTDGLKSAFRDALKRQ